MKRIDTIAHVATTVSAIIALLIFVNKLHSDSEQRKLKELFDWKQHKVYEIISEFDWIGFDKIKELYLNAAQQEKNNVVNKLDLQDATLRAILFDLIARNMIEIRSDNTYSLRYGMSELQEIFINQQQSFQQSQDIISLVLTFLSTDSGKYSVDGVFTKINQKNNNINSELYYSTVTHLIADRRLYIDGNGKLCSSLNKKNK